MSLNTTCIPTPTPTVPLNFAPRPYQVPALDALYRGKLRACCIWHRRAGKEKTFLNFTIVQMNERVGAYYYFFPTYNQGRKILWDGADKDGFRFLSHFPPELIIQKSESEMKIRFDNGSLFQVVGTDNMDSIVGTNPIGCVFSEYALQNPLAWDLMRPILRENGGWAVFDYTPRGKNHGYTLYQMAADNPDWFCEVLTVKDTGVISEADIAADRREGMTEDLIQQEYYCSFNANIQGSYYGALLQKAEEESRITRVPYDPMLPVYTAWDLGIGDATGIWFVQAMGMEFRFIDYYESTGLGLSDYAKKLQEKPYVYADHIMPHDIKVRELGTGKSRYEIALELGIRPITVAPRLDVDDGINAVRMVLPRCWYDAEKCKQGLAALREYHKEWDEDRKEFKNKPYHDWTSHGADAKRTFATGFRPTQASLDIKLGRIAQGAGAWMG